MEDYIFKTYFKMTGEEYKKMNLMSLRRHWIIYTICVFIPLLLSLDEMIKSKSFVSLLIMYCCLIVVALFFAFWIRMLMFKRNPRVNEYEQTTYFYEERLEADTKIAHIKLNYQDLYHVVETKTNFYLYLTWKSLFIVPKSECSPENIAFLQNVAKNVNSLKKRFF